MGVFSRKKITEDVPVEEERQEEVKTSSSVKSVLEGSLLAEKLRQNIHYPAAVFIFYFNAFSISSITIRSAFSLAYFLSTDSRICHGA